MNHLPLSCKMTYSLNLILFQLSWCNQISSPNSNQISNLGSTPPPSATTTAAEIWPQKKNSCSKPIWGRWPVASTTWDWKCPTGVRTSATKWVPGATTSTPDCRTRVTLGTRNASPSATKRKPKSYWSENEIFNVIRNFWSLDWRLYNLILNNHIR